MPSASDSPALIGIDVGTQSIRASAFDTRGRKIAQATRPTPVRTLERGRGEYDPESLFTTVLVCLPATARAPPGRPLAGLALARPGESCVLRDEQGRSLAPAIVWHDRRTEGAARALGAKIGIDRLFELTGLALDPTLTLCKLAWMRRHWPDAVARARRIHTMADWIAFCVGGISATHHTLASRTLYFVIHRREWSEVLLALVDLTPDVLAPLAASVAPLGPVCPEILTETG